jgi:hypothetical protein
MTRTGNSPGAATPEHGATMTFRRRGIEAIAGEGDRLSPGARVQHVQSLAPAHIELPALRFGTEFLSRWPVREEPMPDSWQDAGYDCVTPALFIVRDAVVHTSSGLVTIGPDVVEETLVRLDPSIIGALLSEHTLSLPVSKVTQIKGTHITLLACGTANFFHAMLDSLARSASLPHQLLAEASSVLLSAQGSIEQNIFPHLQLPRHLAMRKVPNGESLHIETLVLPMTVYGTSSYHPVVGHFFDRVSSCIPVCDTESFPKRIYLDRRGASSRRLVNEDEVVGSLARQGFVPVSLEKLSLPDQVRLFRGAEAIVAPHGAGLTNVGFCHPACVVLELQMDAYVHWGFRHLAALRGLSYDCIIGRALGPWPDRSPAVHGLRWVISAEHVAAAAQTLLVRV